MAAAFQQPLGSEANAVLSNHTEDNKFSISRQPSYEFGRMLAFEDVEGLLFEKDLLELRQIGWQPGCRLVWYGDNLLRQRFGNIGGSWSAFDTVGRKSFEFWVVSRVIAAVRDEKDAALAGSIGELADVGQQTFGAGNIEFAAGNHKVRLRVDFPEDDIAR